MSEKPGTFVKPTTYMFTVDEVIEESPRVKPKSTKPTPKKPVLNDRFTDILNLKPNPKQPSIVKPPPKPYTSLKKIRPQTAKNPPKDEFAYLFEPTEPELTLTEAVFGRPPLIKPQSSIQKLFTPQFSHESPMIRPKTAGPSALPSRKPKTLSEIRTADKFREKAAAQTQLLLQKVEESKGQRKIIENKRASNFKKAESAFQKTISATMHKISLINQQNQESFDKLKTKIDAADLSFMTNHSKPDQLQVEFARLFAPKEDKPEFFTEVFSVKQRVDFPKTEEQTVKTPQKESEINLISDDDSFMQNIDSPEALSPLNMSEVEF